MTAEQSHFLFVELAAVLHLSRTSRAWLQLMQAEAKLADHEPQQSQSRCHWGLRGHRSSPQEGALLLWRSLTAACFIPLPKLSPLFLALCTAGCGEGRGDPSQPGGPGPRGAETSAPYTTTPRGAQQEPRGCSVTQNTEPQGGGEPGGAPAPALAAAPCSSPCPWACAWCMSSGCALPVAPQ